MNQFVKQAYVQGLAARAILRARIMQKRAGGVKDYAMAGGVGAGGGALIGALINYARKKSLLQGALAGAGIGGVAGLGYQGLRDLLKGKDSPYAKATYEDIVKNAPTSVGYNDLGLPEGRHLDNKKDDGKIAVDVPISSSDIRVGTGKEETPHIYNKGDMTYEDALNAFTTGPGSVGQPGGWGGNKPHTSLGDIY